MKRRLQNESLRKPNKDLVSAFQGPIIELMLVGHFIRNFIFSKRAGALVRRIAWLSMIGIGISITAFLVVLFVMNGMNASIRKRILGLEPHLSLTIPAASSGESLEIHPAFLRLKENPENRVYVYESQDVIIRTQDGQFRGGVARGVTEESLKNFLQMIHQMQLKSDESESHWDPNEVPGEGEVILGVDLAMSLGVYEGDYVTLISPSGLLLPPGETPRFERVRVSRIITTSLSDIDAQYLFYQRGATLKVLARDGMRSQGIEAWLQNPDQLESMQAELLRFDGVSVQTWMERNSALLYALKLEKLTIGTFLGLSGMIASTSIITVLALLLSQKRRDIAILRTIGLSGQRAVRTFTWIGFFLAGIGVFCGIILGTAIGYYIQKNPIQLTSSQIYYDPSIPALVDLRLVAGVLVVSILIVGLGAYIPARTASEVQPSDALREK
jgi:lipoprotein-releasing system permease protein